MFAGTLNVRVILRFVRVLLPRYGQDVFIDDIFTMKGGIVYPYYWYVFTAVVYKDPSYADGLVKAYVEENKMIDTLDPTTGRREYAMWTFCNNHDNWRLQSMVNSQALRMCLAVITFWSGPEFLPKRTLSSSVCSRLFTDSVIQFYIDFTSIFV